VPKSAEAAKPVAMADEVDAFDYALLTPGFWAGEHYFEGRADALIPLFDCTERDGMLFFNGRGAWADEGEEEMNLGLVLRRRCLPGGGIVGLNTYYDSRWTRQDAHYNQWGAGAEVLTKWIDARANYYLPEHKEEHLGSEEVVTVLDTKTVTRYDQYAVRDQLSEKWNAYRYDTLQHDRYDFYAYPMKGYDAEIGALLPLGFQDVEARLFVGYYDSDDTPRDTQSYMTVDIIGNTIAGNGNRIGQGFYGLEVMSEVIASDDALDSERLWFWEGFADMPGDIGVVLPPELTTGGLDGDIPESYFDWEDQTANGFSGVLVSFSGVTEGGRARVRDNAISGYRNGMYAAVQDIDDADPISLSFLENTSAHNILVGDTADYTLTQTGAGQDLFLNLFY